MELIGLVLGFIGGLGLVIPEKFEKLINLALRK